MIAKYRFKEEQAEFFQSFMSPMLNCYPEKRLLAREILKHSWLYQPCPEEYLMYPFTYSAITRPIKGFVFSATT